MAATSTDSIDRKIFYIQSKLLESSYAIPAEQVLSEAQLWFQPRHFTEIIEERSNDGRCGFPTCTNSITRPIDVSSILKISYKEKRLYEIGRSKLFCCSACSQKSITFEATLQETHPASRQVAIDFLKSNADSSDVKKDSLPSDYFAPDPASIVHHDNDSESPLRDLPPPKFHNPLLTASGATRPPPVGSTPIQSQAAQLSRNLPTKPTKIPSAEESIVPIISFTSETNSVRSSTSSLPILNYSKIKKPELRKKKVGFTDLESLESSVEEKWVGGDVPTNVSKNPTIAKKLSLQSLDYTNMNQIQARTSSLTIGAITEKITASPDPIIVGEESRAEGSIILAKKTAQNTDLVKISEETQESDFRKIAEDNDDGDGYDDDSAWRGEEDISLFILMWTTLDDLFGDCVSVISSPIRLGSDATLGLSSSSATPVASQGSVSILSPITDITVRDNTAEEDIIEERQCIDPTLLASQRSVAMFVERGFNTAEKNIELNSFLRGDAMSKYLLVKAVVLTSVAQNAAVCPRLKSSEFTLLALLVIDAIVSSQALLDDVTPNGIESIRWSEKLKLSAVQTLRVRSGRQVEKQNSKKLREGDLELLRNFFPRKLL